MELIASEYGVSKTFMLPLIEYGATDFKTGVSLATGDVQISKNEGAFANIATLPTILGAWMIVTLSATEMQANRIAIQVIDQTATKVFEDTGAILTTAVEAWYHALFSLIESQRGSHTGIDEIIYFDPVGGHDTNNSGLAFHEPKLTYSFEGANGVHSLLKNNAHQIVILLPSQSGGPTTVTEYIEIDKAYTFLRGPGRDWLIEANHNEACAVLASAEGVELSGMRVKTKATGSQDAICVSGDFASISNVHVDFSRGSGIVLDNTSSCKLDGFLVQDSAQGGSGHAVHILGDTSITTRNVIGNGRIFGNAGDGIRVDGSFCEHNFVIGGPRSLLIHDNTGWGINEVNTANHTIVIGPTIHFGHNTLGTFNLTGDDSVAENTEQWGTETQLDTMETKIDAIPTTQINITSGTGGSVSVSYAQEGTIVEVVAGDVVDIPYNLTVDLTNKTIFFAAKKNVGDTTYAIAVKEITSSILVAADGTGTIPLVAVDTNALETGKYKAELEIRDADQTSNPITTMKFDLDVKGQIIV